VIAVRGREESGLPRGVPLLDLAAICRSAIAVYESRFTADDLALAKDACADRLLRITGIPALSTMLNVGVELHASV